jgi:hypothetical protein
MIKWRKASRSDNTGGNCIELSEQLVRDSKNPSGPRLRADVRGLLAAIKAGRVQQV